MTVVHAEERAFGPLSPVIILGFRLHDIQDNRNAILIIVPTQTHTGVRERAAAYLDIPWFVLAP